LKTAAPQRDARMRLRLITQCATAGLTAEPKVLALVQERFLSILWHFPYLERIRGVLGGVPTRGSVGPPGPLESAALATRPPSSKRGPPEWQPM
jgi:hypothetical protein